jgi:hypothetical protein
VALDGDAYQLSDYSQSMIASKAIDGNNGTLITKVCPHSKFCYDFANILIINYPKVTFSHTSIDDYLALWSVSLKETFQIDKVTILNRHCGSDLSDPYGCLCRLDGLST